MNVFCFGDFFDGAFPKVSHSIQVEEHTPSHLEPHNPGYALVGQAT